MSALKSLFGPSREEIWRRLAREVSGRFLDGSAFKSSAVQVRHDELDHHARRVLRVELGRHLHPAPRPLLQSGTLQVPDLPNKPLFSDLGKAFGMQDIEVGHPRFDRDFVIKGNAPGRVRRLFDNEKIRRLIDAQPRIHMSVKAHEGMLSKFPAGVDELHFQASGTIKDLDRLRLLFDLFAEGPAGGLPRRKGVRGRRPDPHAASARTRRADKGTDTCSGRGNEPRRDAAAALGRLGDPASGPALTSVLEDKDTVLVARAIAALARIGDARATGPPRLQTRRHQGGRRRTGHPRSRGRRVAATGRRWHWVDAVMTALEGDFARLKAYDGEYGKEIIRALCNSIRWRAATHPAKRARRNPRRGSAAAAAGES